MMDKYLEAAKCQLEIAEKKKAAYRGECCDCRHFVREAFWGLDGDKCANPFVKLVVFNNTDPYAKKRLDRADEQRRDRSVWGEIVCGPLGALFEPR